MADVIYSAATIGGFHTWKDWKAIIQNDDVVGDPVPNTTYIEVPGSNGHLDLTEALTGDITYQNRTLTFQLAFITSREKWPKQCEEIFNKLHGRSVQVILDEEPTHFFIGRVSVSDVSRAQIAGQLTISVDCDPYRYEINETKVSYTSTSTSSTTTYSLTNSRMWVCPTVKATAACEIIMDGVTYSIKRGTQKRLDIILKEGTNTFQINGKSTLTFTYRKGCL